MNHIQDPKPSNPLRDFVWVWGTATIGTAAFSLLCFCGRALGLTLPSPGTVWAVFGIIFAGCVLAVSVVMLLGKIIERRKP
jgi:hypothetical protein